MTRPPVLPTVGVLAADGLHLAGPRFLPGSLRAAHVGDLYALARRHGLKQVWLHPSWVRASGLPEALPPAELSGAPGTPPCLAHPFVRDATEFHSFPDGLNRWLNLNPRRIAGAGVAVAFPGYDGDAAWDTETDGATLLAAVLAYAAAVGLPYVRSAGKTGRDLLNTVGGRGGPRDAVRDWPPPAREANTAQDTVWIRALTPAERDRAYLHGYDKNALWLGAAGTAELGLGDLTELRGTPADTLAFDDKLPGYWYAAIAGAAPAWVCTPVLRLARDRGQEVTITHAHVWRRHSRAMEPWYKRLRDARFRLQADPSPAAAVARGALKLTYAVTISTFNRAGLDAASPDYRPDWRHAILAQGAANLARALDRMAAGGCPAVAVHVDCIYIVSDDPDPRSACPPGIALGAGLGDFKVHDAAIPLQPLLPAFTPGAPGAGMKRLLRGIGASTGETREVAAAWPH